MGLADSAISYYRMGLRIDSSVSEMHKRLGVVYASARRFDESETEYRRALALDPRGTEAYTLLGKLFHSLGRDRDAAKLLEEGSNKCTPDQSYLQFLVQLYRTLGETPKETQLRSRFSF